MARIRNGIFGGYRNKLGGTIGQCYGGASVVRAMPQEVKNPRTPSQESHRSIFKRLSDLMSQTNGVMRGSMWNKNSVENSFNTAMRYNWKNNVKNGLIDYENLVFGVFECPDFVGMQVSAAKIDNDVSCVFTWDDTQISYWLSPDDTLVVIVLVVTSTNEFKVLYCQDTETKRESGSFNLLLSNAAIDYSQDNLIVYYAVSPYDKPKGHNPQKPKEIINIPAKVIARSCAILPL